LIYSFLANSLITGVRVRVGRRGTRARPRAVVVGEHSRRPTLYETDILVGNPQGPICVSTGIEVAARAPPGVVRYVWSSSPFLEQYHSQFVLRGTAGTAPVDSYPAQTCTGVRHLLGNVWEWVKGGTADKVREPGRQLCKPCSLVNANLD